VLNVKDGKADDKATPIVQSQHLESAYNCQDYCYLIVSIVLYYAKDSKLDVLRVLTEKTLLLSILQ